VVPAPKPRRSRSMIMKTATPEDRKHPWYNRLSTLRFRTRQLLSRAWHCLHTRARHWQGSG